MSNVFRPVVSFARFVSFAGAFVSLSLCLSLASEASAQTTDAIGVRAQGMAGAFTAAAGDPPATQYKTAGGAGGSALVQPVGEFPPRENTAGLRPGRVR